MVTVVFLGTGGIMPTKERNVPAIAIRYKGEIVLFDAGEGTIRQMNTASLSPMKVDKIFITHFHGDHYLGLAALIQTMNLWNRTKPLHIYGPEGSAEFVKNLLRSGYFKPAFDVVIHEIGEVRLRFGEYEIWSFEVEHGIPALGYVFKERDRRGHFDLEKIRKLGLKPGPWMKVLEERGEVEVSGMRIRLEDVTGPKRRGIKIVYSGDTEPCERLKLFARRADLLIHEATYIREEHRRDSYHTTVEEACAIAQEAKARLLALFHRAPRYPYDEYVAFARKVCQIPFIVPRDLDILTVGGE
ncbi:ribonuclease Z [Pyrococcus yayanosii]|uniref:Ribonuclease Z n=1 Tax=Pyrococcus yayanosii (strain CH1 / JCM 16557) TaxID=529709 RepID=F8AIY0_PYRYC|nr:ribonuclease Z [Pyrococcus yayanosii]AEH24455.1 ribonuclease Z [Pyrococcus yayanosii CH1]